MADLELDGPNSAISVDTLKPKSATTLTLGESGDTIALGSGATATGFTPNGVVDWQTTVKTASFTAVAGEGYFINTSSSAITVTLPSSPSAGNPISIVDYSGNAGTNNITINPNGNKFFSGTGNRTLNQDRAAIAIVYVDSTQGWVVDASYLEGTGIAGLPGAPTIGTATATGTTTATVSFTAPANDGDSAITSYTATSSPDGITGTLSQAGSGTITVSGLTQGASYTFTVTATNAIGTGPASAASNSITTFNPQFVTATGGTITTSGDFKIHTFTSSGTFSVSNAGNPAGSDTVDYLVIAGGGSGGSDGGGGGGAGGYRESFPNPATGGLSIAAQSYPITVGGGGAGTAPSSRTDGADGSNSVFSSITSTGGGGGGLQGNNPGRAGGSGGGGGARGGATGPGNNPAVSPPQGNPGGGGNGTTGSPSDKGGGGGGAGGSGQAATNGGGGGGGTSSSINASSVSRAGGGGGGGGPGGPGPSGGSGATAGGAEGSNSSSASSNTGSGSGGGGMGPAYSGSGASGIVIIRYKFQ